MDNIRIRELKAEEIECHIGTVNEKGLSLLLYKEARADMRIPDETFGCLDWKRTHQSIDGNLYCTVSLWDGDKKEWIDKQDVGKVSYAEKEKCQVSDGFKRACVSVGIGRELYSAPFIRIQCNRCKIQRKNDKWICYDRFLVSDISYGKNREITGLTILNQETGEVVYSFGKKDMQVFHSDIPRFSELDAVLSRYGDMTFRSECYGEYHEGCIKDYYYKPSPIFHKRKDEESPRYYGVEPEIDRGGKDDSNAELIFQKANQHDDVLYIKPDGSLDEGLELVSHHCSVLYHKLKIPKST